MNTSNIQTKTKNGTFLILSVLLLFLLSYSLSSAIEQSVTSTKKRTPLSLFHSLIIFPELRAWHQYKQNIFLTDAIKITSRYGHLGPCPCPSSSHYLTRLHFTHTQNKQ
ncbi:hypothetical protein F5H01DRAFT_344971 [Linnemannia elongata]|nr:hypothetical protein F5H01DRAFT_344971 [Linnemannia elongata]